MQSTDTSIPAQQRNRTTYRIGLLQAKAFRILKSHTAKVLKPLDLNAAEWALLGLVYEHESIRPSEAAHEIGVEPPFITTMVAKLKKKGVIRESVEVGDKRSKSIALTESGKKFVVETEQIVRKDMRSLIGGVNATDLMGYLAVIETIIASKHSHTDNSGEIKKTNNENHE